MRGFWLALGLIFGAGAAQADSDTIPAERMEVLTCLEAMSVDTTWGQCVTLLFAPCAELAVGSEDHVSCLTDEHRAWQGAMDGERTRLLAGLTSAGASELTELMGQWFGYVAQKCGAVAAGKPATGAEAAQLGCEISEIAGVTAEFVACRAGRSTAPYCVMQE